MRCFCSTLSSGIRLVNVSAECRSDVSNFMEVPTGSRLSVSLDPSCIIANGRPTMVHRSLLARMFSVTSGLARDTGGLITPKLGNPFYVRALMGSGLRMVYFRVDTEASNNAGAFVSNSPCSCLACNGPVDVNEEVTLRVGGTMRERRLRGVVAWVIVVFVFFWVLFFWSFIWGSFFEFDYLGFILFFYFNFIFACFLFLFVLFWYSGAISFAPYAGGAGGYSGACGCGNRYGCSIFDWRGSIGLPWVSLGYRCCG